MISNIKNICHFIDLKKGEIKCLEIGAGSAIFSRTLKQLFPKYQISLLDKSFKTLPENIKQNFTDNSFELIEADAENVSLIPNSFDLIIAYNFFRHCPETKLLPIFNNCQKLLKKEGKFCIIDISPYTENISEQVMKEYFFLEAEIDLSQGKIPENFYIMNSIENILNLTSFKSELFIKKLDLEKINYSKNSENNIIEHLQSITTETNQFSKKVNKLTAQIKESGIMELNKFLMVLTK